jgi:hypothetical protein
VHLPSSLHAFEKEERRREMESALLNVCNTQRITHSTHHIHRQMLPPPYLLVVEVRVVAPVVALEHVLARGAAAVSVVGAERRRR